MLQDSAFVIEFITIFNIFGATLYDNMKCINMNMIVHNYIKKPVNNEVMFLTRTKKAYNYNTYDYYMDEKIGKC